MVDRYASEIRGLPVILPDGRVIGTINDTIVETDTWKCSHIFVANPPSDLVEGRIHISIPWHWIRSVNDVVILRWFPPTPIPRDL
jgi:sporulation protein YlmC with PRC-barrel domain